MRPSRTSRKIANRARIVPPAGSDPTGTASVVVCGLPEALAPSIAGFGMNWQHCARMAFVAGGPQQTFATVKDQFGHDMRLCPVREFSGLHLVPPQGLTCKALLSLNVRPGTVHARVLPAHG